LENSEIQEYDLTINTENNEEDLNIPDELIIEHYSIIHWISRLSSVRTNPDELINLLIDINR